MDKEKILNFLKNENIKRAHTFDKWRKEIIFMRKQNATLDQIIRYLFIEDEGFKNKYKFKKAAAITLLSRYIRRIKLNDKVVSTRKIKNNENKKNDIVVETADGNAAEKNKKTAQNNDSLVISLVDGSFITIKKKFLKNYAISNNESGLKHHYTEKDYIVIPNKYDNKDFDFNAVISSFIEKDLIKDYSLIIHINTSVDNKYYVYRLFERKINLIENFIPSRMSHLDEYINKGIEKFYQMYCEHLE